MPGLLKPNTLCPACGKRVIAVFNDWRRSEGIAVREYHHFDDPQKERAGLKPSPCTVAAPYDEAWAKYLTENES